MKKLALLVAAATGASILWTAAASGSNERTLVFHGSAATPVFIDNTPRGESAGDVSIFGRVLTVGGHRAGRMQFLCTEVDSRRHAQECSGTAVLSTGAITAAGAVAGDARTVSFAVTGGTGAYAGERGTLTSRMGRGDTSIVTVRLFGAA